MKNVQKMLVAIMLAFMTSISYSQDFNLQLRNIYGDIFESLSGVIVITDGDCDVNEYEPITLHYYNKPYTGVQTQAPINNSNYNPFSGILNSNTGQLRDNFTYTVQEPQIINPRQCLENQNSAFGGGECIPETFEPYLDYVDVVKTCKVYGVAKLADTGQEVVTYDSRSVFDATSGRLYIFDTEIWNHLQDSGSVFTYAQFKLEDGVFVPELLQATPETVPE